MKNILFVLTFLAAIAVSSAPAQTGQIRNDNRGVLVGKNAAAKVGLHGATPVAQRAGSAQAAVTATVGAAVDTTASTTTTPYGFTTAAQADALVARVNQLRADSLAQTTLINELRAALVQKGAIKGGP